MKWALPSKKMSLALIRGARDLFVRMEVPTLILCERPLVGRNSRKKIAF
jgi:hypothetical protein